MFRPDWFKRLEHFTQFAGMDDALLQAPTAPQANDPGQIPQIVRTAQYSIGK
jgi:hypothetical protein